MRRVAGYVVVGALGLGLAGCCAGPERFYENAYGFNNPNIEHYPPGPQPPVTTPPGYSEPAVVIADTQVPEEGPPPPLEGPTEARLRRRPQSRAGYRAGYRSEPVSTSRAEVRPTVFRR